jgi:hypothetical protein
LEEGTTELRIELKSEGKKTTILVGITAEIVDKAITRALMVIANEKAKESKAVTGVVGDDFIAKEMIKIRKWIDTEKPEGFSYSEAIRTILDEIKSKGIMRKEDKIEYMVGRIIDLRQQAQPQKSSCEKVAA